MQPDAIDEILGTGPTTTIRKAAKILNIGINGAYEAAKRGEIPTITIGKRKLVVVAKFKEMLGLAPTAGVTQ